MSSCSPISLRSLDESLALLNESFQQIKAAKSFDRLEVCGQLEITAESASIVRAAVWSELPDASWRNRQELDSLIDQIQEIVAARAVQQQRSRLMALATALESGTIVHRRAQRASELKQLRDLAVHELRSVAVSDDAPQTLPGPPADNWLGWAWGLQEPQDAESLQALRSGFVHLDDFVANLEPNMWISGPRVPALLPEHEKSPEIQTERPRTEEKRTATPAMSSVGNLDAGVSFDPKDKSVPHRTSNVNPPLNRLQEVAATAEETGIDGAVLTSALTSLDSTSAVLDEYLERLRAAQSVDMAEVSQQLTMAAESGRVVRASVWAELPEASWQNRKGLDALVEQIQAISAVRILEQRRSRLLALATELDRGHIVHRRTQRAHELNQLRGLAINELRSQAGLDGAPQSLPGPQAEQWIEWACGLQEPEDAESLQALRSGFVHLDDFVANLERNMWFAAEPPKAAIPPKPKKYAEKPQTAPSRMERGEFEEPGMRPGPMHVEMEVAQFSGAPSEMAAMGPRDELPPLGLESNTLTPNDVTPPRTEEDELRILAQEHSLRTGLMHLIRGPAGQYNAAAERPFTAALFRETGAVSTHASVDPRAHAGPPVESPPPPEVSRDTSATQSHSVVPPVVEFPVGQSAATEVLQAVNAETVRPVRGRAALLRSPVLRPIARRVFREKSAAPSDMADDRVRDSGPPVLRPFLTKDRGEVSAAATPLPEVATEVAETWALRWPVRMVAAVLVLAAVGAVLWKSRANTARKTPIAAVPVAAIETTPPALPPANPVSNQVVQSDTAAGTETKASTAKLSSKEQKEPRDRSLSPSPAAKTSNAKPGNTGDKSVLSSPMVVPGNIVVAKSAESAANDTTETPTRIPSGLPATTSKDVRDIVMDIPVAAPNAAEQTVRISSGVTQTLLIHQVPPRYPQGAMMERVEGTVVLQALITKDGSVQNLKVLSGHPLLNQAAIDAVKQWRYKPYQLNGEPVEAVTQINVKFKFAR